MEYPCSLNPELWFGYPDDDAGDGAFAGFRRGLRDRHLSISLWR